MSGKKQSTRRPVPVQGSFHLNKKPPLLHGSTPRKAVSLDAFGFNTPWEELLATEVHVTHPTKGAWWARALEGQLCFEQLLKRLNLQLLEGAWVRIFWSEWRMHGRLQRVCVLKWRPPGKRRSNREWGGLRGRYIPQPLWPLARAAAYYLQCREKLEGLLGP